MRSREERAAGRAEDDGLSRKEFRECCPLIWSQPRALTTSLSRCVALSLLCLFSHLALSDHLLGFLFPCHRRRRVSDGRRQIENAKRPTHFFDFSLYCVHEFVCVHVARAEKGEQECIMRVFVKQNRE